MADTNRNYNKKQAMSLADISPKKMMKDIKKPAWVLFGLVSGVPMAMLVERTFGKKSTVSGLLGIDGDKLTRILKPTVNIAVGMGISQLVKNPNIKLAGIGLAANGGLIAIKDFLGKDLLKGLDGTDLGEIAALPGQQPPVQVIERAIEAHISEPLDLPLLDIDGPGNEAGRYIENMANDVQGAGAQSMGSGAAQPEDIHEDEIILSSDRPEDNFEPEPEEDVAGDLELVIEDEPKAQIPHVQQIVTDKDVEDELDFTDIP